MGEETAEWCWELHGEWHPFFTGHFLQSEDCATGGVQAPACGHGTVCGGQGLASGTLFPRGHITAPVPVSPCPLQVVGSQDMQTSAPQE